MQGASHRERINERFAIRRPWLAWPGYIDTSLSDGPGGIRTLCTPPKGLY